MSFNEGAGFNSSYSPRKENFAAQLKRVLEERKFLQYKHLISVWKYVGEKTTITVYPILQEIAKLFSGIEWCGDYGGLKVEYEQFVPEKFKKEYRRVMFGEMSTKQSYFDPKIKKAALNLENLSQQELDVFMSNPNTSVSLRDSAFYRFFDVEYLDDSERNCEKWDRMPLVARRILCFDLKSVTEMSIFLRRETIEIVRSLGTCRHWPAKICVAAETNEILRSNTENLANTSLDNFQNPKNPTSQIGGKNDFSEKASDRPAEKSNLEDLSEFRQRSSVNSDSSFDLSDLDIDEEDEEMQQKLRRFEEEVLGVAKTDNSKNNIADLIKKSGNRTDSANANKTDSNNQSSTEATNEPKKFESEKSEKKGRKCGKSRRKRMFGRDEADLETENLVKAEISSKRSHRRGPLVTHSDEEDKSAVEDFAQKNADGNDFARNFNAEDFIPDFEEEDRLDFVQQYNSSENRPQPDLGATGAAEQKQKEKTKGFFNENEVRNYVEASDHNGDVKMAEDFRGKEEDAIEVKIDRLEDEENWKRSLKRNALIRTKNSLEAQTPKIIDPKNVDAKNFGSKGELLSGFFKSRFKTKTETEFIDNKKSENEQNKNKFFNLQQKEINFKKSETRPITKKEGFQPWNCSCGARNGYKNTFCGSCRKQNKQIKSLRLRCGHVAHFDRRKGAGTVLLDNRNTKSEKGLKNPKKEIEKSFVLRRHAIWTADLAVFPGEEIYFRAGADGEVEALTSAVRARRMMLGDCVKLVPAANAGWIRIMKGGRRKSDIFFQLSDYESGQKVEVGMPLRFEIDLAVSQPRAFRVKPLLERIEEVENEVGNLSDFRKSKPNTIFGGQIIEWDKDIGLIRPDNGADNVSVSSSAALTIDRTFNVGDKVDFTVDLSTIFLTGHVSAKQVIRSDPCDYFYGRVKSISPNKFGFLEAEPRWMAKDVYFNEKNVVFWGDKLNVGKRVKFFLLFTARGFAAGGVDLA